MCPDQWDCTVGRVAIRPARGVVAGRDEQLPELEPGLDLQRIEIKGLAIGRDGRFQGSKECQRAAANAISDSLFAERETAIDGRECFFVLVKLDQNMPSASQASPYSLSRRTAQRSDSAASGNSCFTARIEPRR